MLLVDRKVEEIQFHAVWVISMCDNFGQFRASSGNFAQFDAIQFHAISGNLGQFEAIWGNFKQFCSLRKIE